MSGQDLTAPTELSRLPRPDDWLILPTPAAGTNRAAIDVRAREHARWPLPLERDDALFRCGPLLSGSPARAGPRSDRDPHGRRGCALPIAARNAVVLAGLRTFSVRHWRLNQGGIAVRISPGTATHDWR